MDNCNESNPTTFISSNLEQVSVGQRPYRTGIKLYLSSSNVYSSVAKTTCSINKELDFPRAFNLAIPDGSDLVKVRVTLFTNGILRGSQIISRGQKLNFVLNYKFVNDYTIVYQAVQGDGFLYAQSRG